MKNRIKKYAALEWHLAHPSSSARELALACNVSVQYAERFLRNRITKLFSEETFEWHFACHLEDEGIAHTRQFSTAAGVADIVTPNAIYELKLWLDRRSLMHAVGQVLVLREALNPQLKAVVVGQRVQPDDQIAKFAERVGVEVLFWSPLRWELP